MTADIDVYEKPNDYTDENNHNEKEHKKEKQNKTRTISFGVVQQGRSPSGHKGPLRNGEVKTKTKKYFNILLNKQHYQQNVELKILHHHEFHVMHVI